MRWSVIQKAHAVEVFHRMASPTRALRALRREWGREAAPDRRVLGRWVAEFQRAGSVPGATRRARSRRANPSMVAAVQRAIRRSPRLSMRRLSAKTGVSRSWVHCILRQQLRLYPYKLQLVQRLHRGDKAKRLRFCRWILDKWGSPSFRRSLLFSDEANFYLNGQVHKQNCRIWGDENPHALVEQDQQSPHLTVWCGLSSRGILGPYFFQSRGRTVTVTGPRYKGMLDDFLVPALRRRHIPLSQVWFQQDGATPHTTRVVLARLHSLFPGKVLSKGGTVPWPPRSPDLSPLDFFLWGQVKATVFAQPPRSLRQLRARIREALRSITTATLQRAVDNVAFRARHCLRVRGRHIESLLSS